MRHQAWWYQTVYISAGLLSGTEKYGKYRSAAPSRDDDVDLPKQAH